MSNQLTDNSRWAEFQKQHDAKNGNTAKPTLPQQPVKPAVDAGDMHDLLAECFDPGDKVEVVAPNE